MNMSYYSTDSEEHQINTGEKEDPVTDSDWFFEDPIYVVEELAILEDVLGD